MEKWPRQKHRHTHRTVLRVTQSRGKPLSPTSSQFTGGRGLQDLGPQQSPSGYLGQVNGIGGRTGGWTDEWSRQQRADDCTSERLKGYGGREALSSPSEGVMTGRGDRWGWTAGMSASEMTPAPGCEAPGGMMLSANESGAMSVFGGLGDDALGLHASPESAAGGGEDEEGGGCRKNTGVPMPRRILRTHPGSR